MYKVTYGMLKEFVSVSTFAQTHGISVNAFGGFYHIVDKDGRIITGGRTPRECLERFNVLTTGYYMGVRDSE